VTLAPEVARDDMREQIRKKIKNDDLYEGCREVGMGGSRIRFQMNGRQQLFDSFRILRLRGVNEAKEFVEVKAVGRRGKQFFEKRGGFWIVAGLVLADGELELAIEVRG